MELLRDRAALPLQRAMQSCAAPQECPHGTITGFCWYRFSAQLVIDGHKPGVTEIQTVASERLNRATAPSTIRPRWGSAPIRAENRCSSATHDAEAGESPRSLTADSGMTGCPDQRPLKGKCPSGYSKDLFEV
jgi:hypothetical protein